MRIAENENNVISLSVYSGGRRRRHRQCRRNRQRKAVRLLAFRFEYTTWYGGNTGSRQYRRADHFQRSTLWSEFTVLS